MFIHFKKYTWLGIISSSTQIKSTGQYFFKRNLKKWPSKWELLGSTSIPIVLFIIVCIKCSNLYTCGRNPKVWPSKQHFPLILLKACTISEFVYGTLALVWPFKDSIKDGIFFSPVKKWVLAYAVQGGSNFWISKRNALCLKWNLLNSTCLLCCTRGS